MRETASSESISTKLDRIAETAKAHPDWVLSTLSHHVDLEWMRRAFELTRKDAATGVDGETAAEFAVNLEERLQSLLDRMHLGTYRAPPVKRAYIPKGDGKRRPIGIPTLEDKILQRAVTMVLEAVYEQSFYDSSYGYRPKRSPHPALEALWKQVMSMRGCWLIEADIEGFFDSLDHAHLRAFLDKRVSDGVLRRMIGKWLNAGVLEDGALWRASNGTPQGGVISPLLANIYLHEVLDDWFEKQVKPRLKGKAVLIRYADDFVIALETETDARQLMEVLPKRLGKYALRLHPEKTRIVRFCRPRRKPGTKDDNDPQPEHFDFLGFTHYWGTSRNGNWVVQRKTAKTRFTRAMKQIREWCKKRRHDPVNEQHKAIQRKLRGHYSYYGITGNISALSRFAEEVRKAWRYWLSRRSQRSRLNWARFRDFLRRNPLPRPRIIHSALTSAAKP